MDTLLTTANEFLSDHYLTLKFVHMVFAAIWAWSTSVAYGNYLVPLFRDWQRAPHDPERIRLRNWAMERFDDGAKLEHSQISADRRLSAPTCSLIKSVTPSRMDDAVTG